jgi:uncharacterized protein (DUF2249 family)
MVINANTKIAAVLKHNPAALDAIISISPKFEKLRNPVLRKLMAGRTSVLMASKIGGCSANDFFVKLQPLGFEIDNTITAAVEEKKTIPGFVSSLQPGQIILLDVRPVIASGKDPLKIILEKIKTLQPKQVLKIINTFEPTPLMLVLEKQGFELYADIIHDDLVETYFYKKTATASPIQNLQEAESSKNWDEILEAYEDKMQTIDVCHLETPLPMLTILDALDKLPADEALYVYHKRIPVFLLPELAERKFDYRVKELCDGKVHLLIFRSDDCNSSQ